MLVTRNGVINRQRAAEIRVIGRNTQGVRVISLDDGDELIDLARVARDLEDSDIDEAVGLDEADGTDVETTAEADEGEQELEAAGTGDGAED
jgi:DNA gyrase subunit A